MLTVLGIQYNPEIVVDTSKLEEVIAAYEELDADKYAPESWKVCEDAYNQATELYQKVQAQEVDNYTQDAVDDYIGGRYSSTSAVGGAVLSLAFGPGCICTFLKWCSRRR